MWSRAPGCSCASGGEETSGPGMAGGGVYGTPAVHPPARLPPRGVILRPVRPVSAPLLRVVLAVAAVAVIGWSFVLARDAHRQASALDVIAHRASPATVRASIHLLQAATTWSAAHAPEMYLAGAESLLGQPRRALALAERLAAAEPENASAWQMVALVSRRAFPTRARIAQAHLAALDPLDARR
jgi:hypothetical protein